MCTKLALSSPAVPSSSVARRCCCADVMRDGAVSVGGAWKAWPGGAPASRLRKNTSQLACTLLGSCVHNRYISSAYSDDEAERNDSLGCGGVRVVVASARRPTEGRNSAKAFI